MDGANGEEMNAYEFDEYANISFEDARESAQEKRRNQAPPMAEEANVVNGEEEVEDEDEDEN